MKLINGNTQNMALNTDQIIALAESLGEVSVDSWWGTKYKCCIKLNIDGDTILVYGEAKGFVESISEAIRKCQRYL